MNLTPTVLASAILICATGAHAQSTRLADGKPCHATERTLFDTDGITPFACAPTRGPAYRFQVFRDNKLVAEERLPTDAHEVSGKIKGSGADEHELVVSRCLADDPTGRTAFVGSRRLRGFTLTEAAGNRIHVPQISYTGACLRTDSPGTDHRTGFSVVGQDGTRAEYRVVVRRE